MTEDNIPPLLQPSLPANILSKHTMSTVAKSACVKVFEGLIVDVTGVVVLERKCTTKTDHDNILSK